MTPIGDLLREHGLSHYLYAYDTHVYLFSTFATWKTHANNCAKRQNVDVNDLIVNDEQPEGIHIGSKLFISKLSDFGITEGDNKVCSVSSVQNPGVLFDQLLSMEQFVFKSAKLQYWILDQ